MRVSAIHSSYMFTGKPPKTVKQKAVQAIKEVMTEKPIGEAAAKTEAWWHEGFREAKLIETEVKEGTYKPPKAPEIYNDDGGVNFNYFRTDEDGYI